VAIGLAGKHAEELKTALPIKPPQHKPHRDSNQSTERMPGKWDCGHKNRGTCRQAV